MKQVIVLVVLLLVSGVVYAQQEVTDDEVNDIASKLYCPVCENIPLEVCGTAACDDWRNEVRLYLEDGWTEEQIVDDFVIRFGDQVVGTPQDPALRALSLVTPWIVVMLMLGGTVYIFLRWRNQHGMIETTAVTEPEIIQDDYLAQLERDVHEQA